jgi:hypothetical protein
MFNFFMYAYVWICAVSIIGGFEAWIILLIEACNKFIPLGWNDFWVWFPLWIGWAFMLSVVIIILAYSVVWYLLLGKKADIVEAECRDADPKEPAPEAGREKEKSVDPKKAIFAVALAVAAGAALVFIVYCIISVYAK